jgi:hypothetical protein
MYRRGNTALTRGYVRMFRTIPLLALLPGLLVRDRVGAFFRFALLFLRAPSLFALLVEMARVPRRITAIELLVNVVDALLGLFVAALHLIGGRGVVRVLRTLADLCANRKGLAVDNVRGKETVTAAAVVVLCLLAIVLIAFLALALFVLADFVGGFHAKLLYV